MGRGEGKAEVEAYRKGGQFEERRKVRHDRVSVAQVFIRRLYFVR